MLFVTLVPASSFGRALWPALVEVLLYVRGGIGTTHVPPSCFNLQSRLVAHTRGRAIVSGGGGSVRRHLFQIGVRAGAAACARGRGTVRVGGCAGCVLPPRTSLHAIPFARACGHDVVHGGGGAVHGPFFQLIVHADAVARP